MRWSALFLLLFSLHSKAVEFDFPTQISEANIPVIAHTFTAGFLTRIPMSLLNQDEYRTQVSIRVNSIDTEKVSKLGNQTEDKEVMVQEFSFSKKLPLNVELGVQSSLAVLDKDINTFGGYARWGFRSLPGGSFSLVGHGTSANFKNLVGTNIYGGLITFDTKILNFYFSVGTGVTRSTNSFDRSLFIGASGKSPALNYGRSYSHNSVKVAYNWNNLSIGAQGDWLKEFFSSVNLSYLF